MKYFSKSLKKVNRIKMDLKNTKVINGIRLGESISNHLKNYLIAKKIQLGESYRPPLLKIVQVGDDISSKIYIQNKIKQCEYIGIKGEYKKFSSDISKSQLITEIINYNQDKLIDAVIIQLPLPKSLDPQDILSVLSPEKDVDCLTPSSQGSFYQNNLINNNIILPPTALGVAEMLKLSILYNNDLEAYFQNNNPGKDLLELSGYDIKVLGRGLTAGLPISMLMQKYNGTVTICHSKTKNLENYSKEADILITAIGRPKFITREMVKENAIVIDVGINSNSAGESREVVGDVDFEDVIDKVKYITPVPGGVGRLTVVMLMKNVITAWEKSLNSKGNFS